jgi:hypothetical protein
MTPQPIVKTTSVGGTPGTYDAGSGTTLVTATEWIRSSRTASVVVEACAWGIASVGGCSSVWQASRRVGDSTSTVTCRRTSIAGSKVAS